MVLRSNNWALWQFFMSQGLGLRLSWASFFYPLFPTWQPANVGSGCRVCRGLCVLPNTHGLFLQVWKQKKDDLRFLFFSLEATTLSKPISKKKKTKNKQPGKRKKLAADTGNEININGAFVYLCVFCTHTFRLGSPAVKEERENTEPQHSNEELCELNP